MVSGTTQVVAVIGHPIAQVKSPDNFNRYFAEQHMDSIMIPVDIVPDAVAAYLNALRLSAAAQYSPLINKRVSMARFFAFSCQ